MSEETPLLSTVQNDAISKHEEVYLRFSPSRKRVLVVLVSWCNLIPLFVSGSFIPSIPEIVKEMNSTSSIVSLAISLSVFASSFGALCGASYSTYYGRRPVYLYTLPILCLGSFGVALSRTIPELMVWRFIQSFGCAPSMSVGAGVIGDIYKLEMRGKAMGIFLGSSLLGAALAPMAGGIAAHYASWRVMQLAIGIAGLVGYVVMFFVFPETSHPGGRGIDKLPLNIDGTVPPFKFVFVNPLAPLSLLRSPNLIAISLTGFFVLLTDYVMLVPLAYTIGARYNITNEALIGLCFLPSGLGNMIGAPLAGRLSDRIIVKWRAQRNGIWYPEDRLRATMSGALFLVPLSVFVSGLLIKYVEGRVGLVLNLVCLFINGVGVDIVLSPSAAYLVDIMHSRSAESMATNSGFRSFLMAGAIAAIHPLIDSIGVARTNALVGLLSWIGFGILWFTIRYGDQMRAFANVGYSTAETN